MAGAPTPPAPLREPCAAAGRIRIRHRHACLDGRMDAAHRQPHGRRLDSFMDAARRRMDVAWTPQGIYQVGKSGIRTARQPGGTISIHGLTKLFLFTRQLASMWRNSGFSAGNRRGRMGPRKAAWQHGSRRGPRLSLHPQNHGGLQWPGAFHRPWAPGAFWPCAHRAGQCFFPASPPTAAWCGACTAQKAASAS